MKHFVFLPFLYLSYSALAQSPTTMTADAPRWSQQYGQESFPRYTWDASIDAMFLLPTSYQITNYDYNFNTGYYYYNGSNYNTNNYNYGRSSRFMLRRNDGTPDGRMGAYRLAAYLSGNNQGIKNDSIYVNGNNGQVYFQDSYRSVNLGIAAGYEWQKQLGRFQLFYGYDMTARFFSATDEGQLNFASNSSKPVKTISRSFGVGVAPLVGVKFFIHPRFSLSAESSYTVSYNWDKIEGSQQFYTSGAAKRRNHGFSYGLIPLAALNATFHFGQALR